MWVPGAGSGREVPPPPPRCPAWGPPDKPDSAHHPAGSLLPLRGGGGRGRGSRGLDPGQMEGLWAR